MRRKRLADARVRHYKLGWQARDKVLLESAVEFDEVDLLERYENNPSQANLTPLGQAVDLARYQHSQLTAIYEARIAKLESEKLAALKYCEGRCDQMWAASIVAKLLGGDFREADVTLTTYLTKEGGEDE